MNIKFDFADRVLVLTGANGGIGREIARLFAQSGAHLVLGDLDGAALETFAQELEGPGRKLTCTHNATDPASSQALVNTAVEAFGGIDFVVPGAAIFAMEVFPTMTDAQWHRMISVNLDGLYYLLSRAQKHLRDGSSIVNISSMAGHRGSITNAHYSATKGATTALTRSLAQELAPRTRVNAVAPGIVETPMTKSLIADRGEKSIAATPLQRNGQPQEIAAIVAFLCSDGASYITGEITHANGGLYMGG